MTSAERARPRLPLRPGVAFMVASALAFSGMGVLVKLLGTRLPSQEVVLARALISLLLSAFFVRRAGLSIWGEQRGLLWLRGLFGYAGLSCVFYALSHLPLADATVIQYLHPIFTAGLAATVLGEAVGGGLALGVGLCVGGVLLVVRPAFLLGLSREGLDPFACGVALAGAFFSACAYVVVRRLARREHPLVIVFYFPLVAVPMSLPGVVGRGVMPRGIEWGLLLGVGLLAQLGQVALTRGFQHEQAARATALSYLQVAFAAGWGALFFHEIPDLWSVGGALLILLGSFVAGRL